jgi:hypothetical protein
VLALGTLWACTESGSPNGIAPGFDHNDEAPVLAVTIPTSGLAENVWVCNDDAAGVSFDFTVTGTGSFTLVDGAPTITAGSCTLVASAGDGAQVTVTQTLATGFDFVRIESFIVPPGTNNLDPDPSGPVLVPMITRAFGDRGFVFVFFNEPTPGGDEGCTPGFWKNHTGQGPGNQLNEWVTYATGDDFNAVFGVGPSVTLLTALNTGGGGEAALGRHAVAALLNASSSVDYFYTVAQVIGIVQDAYAIGTKGAFNDAKDDLEAQNGDATFCPLPSNGPID